MSKKKTKSSLNPEQIRDLINTTLGSEVAYNLTKDNPTEVDEWIPTGSRVLDSVTCKGMRAGIPVGKISSIAGRPSTGKSFLAAQIAGNAQRMGHTVVYFDSESAIDPVFMAKSGVDVDSIIYVQPPHVEQVFETVEGLLGTKAKEDKFLFIWDSLAFTVTEKELEESLDPNQSMALRPRVVNKGLKKITKPLAQGNSTFLILNQLMVNIPSNSFDFEARNNPWFTPGGNALKYSYSLEIWLTRRSAKDAKVKDENDFIIGCEVMAEVKKSRFGTEGRQCVFTIEWGDSVGVLDEQSWWEACQTSEYLVRSGSWYYIVFEDGSETKKFRSSEWKDMLQDEKVKERVLEILDEELIFKFAEKRGDAKQFYDVESKLSEFEDGEDE